MCLSTYIYIQNTTHIPISLIQCKIKISIFNTKHYYIIQNNYSCEPMRHILFPIILKKKCTNIHLSRYGYYSLF